MEPELALGALNQLKEREVTADMTESKTVYPHDAERARKDGELTEYRVSNRLNNDCAHDIAQAISKRSGGWRLPDGMAADMVAKYGIKRVKAVLAHTAREQDYDGRYSQDNKDWAGDVYPRPENCKAVNAHPLLLNEYIGQFRQYERESAPIYPHSLEYAEQNGEVDACYTSAAMNISCSQAIDKAVQDSNYEPAVLDGFVDIVRKAHMHKLAQTVGQYEKSHRMARRNRLTYFHSDFGVFVPEANVSHQRMQTRCNEIMEKKAARAERRPSALQKLEDAKKEVAPPVPGGHPAKSKTAALEFVLAKKQYAAITGREQAKDKDALLYQIRQSFKPGEITPEDANRIADNFPL